MEFNTQITKKYSGNIEISVNTCRNTLNFMCDLELFSKSGHINTEIYREVGNCNMLAYMLDYYNLSVLHTVAIQ